MFIGGNFCRAKPAARPFLPGAVRTQPIEIIAVSELARLLQ
jgi:hypothetical protein